MGDQILDEFGKIVMARVRDQTISEWDKMVDGQMKGRTAEHVKKLVSSLDDSEKAIMHQLIPSIVDTTLFYLLFMFEEEKRLRVIMMDNNNSPKDLRSISDGLGGELYGWIPRFSKERHERQ